MFKLDAYTQFNLIFINRNRVMLNKADRNLHRKFQFDNF